MTYPVTSTVMHHMAFANGLFFATVRLQLFHFVPFLFVQRRHYHRYPLHRQHCLRQFENLFPNWSQA